MLLARGSRGQGGRLDVGACAIEVGGSVNTSGINGGHAGTIWLVGHETSIGATARLTSLSCALDWCVRFESDGAAPLVAGGAVINPAPVVATVPVVPACSP